MNIDAATAARKTVFREKLLPSFWGFVMAAIVLPSAYLVFLPINELFGLVLGAALTLVIWAILVAAAPRITVSDGELSVGSAHIPVNFLSDGRLIEPQETFSERGPRLDARAFVRFQMGIKSLVRFENIDQNDPAPYWLIATRRPVELLAAVESERAKNS